MRTHPIFSTVFLLVINSVTLQARIINVPADSSTIQGGINGTIDGDTVMVTPGIYYEHDIDFFGKAITVMSYFPEDSGWVASTVVDADSLGRGFYFHTHEDSNSVLKGLTVTGGSENTGAGINCKDASPKIVYCIITGNSAAWGGGGIQCLRRSPKIRNCTIYGNIVLDGEGGGIECISSSPSITSCDIIGNWVVEGVGGGLSLYESSPIVENCTISQDSAWMSGGVRIRCLTIVLSPVIGRIRQAVGCILIQRMR